MAKAARRRADSSLAASGESPAAAAGVQSDEQTQTGTPREEPVTHEPAAGMGAEAEEESHGSNGRARGDAALAPRGSSSSSGSPIGSPIGSPGGRQQRRSHGEGGKSPGGSPGRPAARQPGSPKAGKLSRHNSARGGGKRTGRTSKKGDRGASAADGSEGHGGWRGSEELILTDLASRASSLAHPMAEQELSNSSTLTFPSERGDGEGAGSRGVWARGRDKERSAEWQLELETEWQSGRRMARASQRSAAIGSSDAECPLARLGKPVGKAAQIVPSILFERPMEDLALSSGAYPGLEPPQHKRYELSTAYEPLNNEASLLIAPASGAEIANGGQMGPPRNCSPTSPLVPLW